MMKKILVVSIIACLAFTWGCHSAPADSTASNKTPSTENIKEVVLFDFSSGSAESGWKSVNDTVMGGVSSSKMIRSDDGNAVFTGTVSLENNGGFASVRGPTISQEIGVFEGIAVRVRGDGKKYKLGLRTDELFDGVFHQAGFTSKKDAWQVVKLPFTNFIPTYHGRRLSEDKRMAPEEIKSVSFLISDKQAGPFQLEIEWIKAYR